MINQLKYSLILLFFIGNAFYAQTPKTIEKTDYTITSSSGPQVLIATESIIIKPTSIIQSGSDFTARISSDDYTALIFSNENYIFNRSYQKALKSSAEITSNKDVIEDITYFDGLARPMQKIAIKASPFYKDVVTRLEYDNIGRKSKDYLPYIDNVDSSASYRNNSETNTNNYYKLNYPSDVNSANPNPFSQKKFEDSPLDRVLLKASPGFDWALGNGHEIKNVYQTNALNEVKLFKVSLTQQSDVYIPTLSLVGYYDIGQLYKTIIKDENWVSGTNNTVEEFSDKDGRLILKKTYGLSVINGVETNTPHETYYIYDDYENLSFVLSPKADGNITDAILNDLCYQYKYDTKNRLVEKKLPGKDWEFIIYDKLDRTILTQDGNLRTNRKWLFTKYDAFDRVVYTGEYTDNVNLTRSTVQTAANNNANLLETRTTTSTTIGTSSANYTNNSFPTGTVLNTSINLFTVNYYDNYSNLGTELDGGTAVDSYNTTPITNAKGLNICSKTRVLGTNSWITDVKYYDVKGRLIYSYNKNNYLNIVTTLKNQLDFGGKTLETVTTHQKLNQPLVTIKDSFSYDHMGRVLTQNQKINSQTEEKIVSNTYDDLGHLITKNVGGKISQPALQNVNLTYNIRGWLKTINDSDTDNNNLTVSGNDLFGFQINYNDSSSGKLYNGNISQILSRTANIDSSIKKYNYTYDSLNRLKHADDNSTNNPGRYNEEINYDKNGNINRLVRFGNLDYNAATFGKMDELTYTYDNGNKIVKVEDLSPSNEGFKNGSTAAKEYDYDLNGNLTIDLNKGIGTSSTQGIFYNHLNLPVKIILTTGTIDYVYDANGIKQSKTINANDITEYADDFVYENSILRFFHHPEGYAANNAGTFDYIYQYKDHLGNIRLSYGDKDNNGSITNSEIIEENNYYPFGLKQKDFNSAFVLGKGNSAGQKYKFGGKELQDDNIGGLQLNTYDFSARNYDPGIGRFTTMDPSSESYKALSPFNYVNNNTINNIDPDGRDIIVLSAPAHVHNLGHAAVLIGNPKTGYYYYSKNGTTKHKGSYGPSDKNPVKGKYVGSLKNFLLSKDNRDKEGSYTRLYEIKTDAKTDKQMKEAAAEAVDSDYNVLYASCIDVASRALVAGGLNPGYTPDAYNPNTYLTSIPNLRMSYIINNNRGGRVIHLPNLPPKPQYKVIVGPLE
ncbi:DUF6443 domain-containing protein [Flavobacterium sp. 3-218]